MAFRYEFPRRHLPGFALDLLLRRPRPFHRDSLLVLAANPYPRVVEGAENVPARGPFVLTMNHYNRRGLRPYHCAMVISAAVAGRRPQEPYIAWVITSELMGQRLGPLPLPRPLTRRVLARAARVYGLVLMPPAGAAVAARAAAAREALRLARRHPIGLAPEGAGSGVLIEPPTGAGLFVLSLTAGGAPVLPVGLWEEGDALRVRFGAPYALRVTPSAPRAERDRLASEQVMTAIGRLLPAACRGAYEGALRSAQGPQPETGPSSS